MRQSTFRAEVDETAHLFEDVLYVIMNVSEHAFYKIRGLDFDIVRVNVKLIFRL